MVLREAAEKVGGTVSPEHAEISISGLASLDDAGEGDISFFGSPKYLKQLQRCQGTAVLVPHVFPDTDTVKPFLIRVDDPAKAFACLLEHFAPPPVTYERGVHPTAVVAPDAEINPDATILAYAVIESGVRIGARTIIGAHSTIGHGARIGEDCHVYSHVTIGERALIGNRVILHPGVVIGSDGFGYEFREGRQMKIPQTGIVQIDDDVEIGANTTIDRARFGRTWIREGAKIDNLVQIAHNVTIGKHSIICAHVGISGSTRVGNYVTLAGKVGVNGHIEIGDGAIVTAMAGITKSVAPKEILIGLPARPMREYKTNYVQLRTISKLYERVQKLEEQAKAQSDS